MTQSRSTSRPRPQRRSRSQRQTTVPIDELPQAKTGVALAGIDRILLYVTVALAVLGLTAVFSASATEAQDAFGNSLYYVQRQFIFFAVGFGMMIGISKLPFMSWSRIAHIFAIVVIGLLLYTLHSGVEAYGAERWIRVFGIQFQPSELGKISVVLLLAQALGQGKKLSFLSVFNGALIMISLLLIYKQPSLSMTLILSGVSFGLLFITGIPLALLGIMMAGGGSYVVYKLLHTEYQLRRIQGWLDPWKDAQDTGYNLIQSLYAIGSGGLIGTGLGMSHQKLYYLPFQYTDFIFSVWAEEWGFIGSLVLMGLFGTLLYRGFVIAKTCRSNFGQLLAMGITMVLGIQVIINLSVATGLFPVTGVTLPLISYGGTSVLVTLLMIGILLNISRYRLTVTPMTRRYGL